MATKAKRHIHKYHRVDLGYANVYACALPDCPHYMPKHMENTLEGKYSFCWGCDEKFILDKPALELMKPLCVNCRLGTVPTEPDLPMAEALRELLHKLEV